MASRARRNIKPPKKYDSSDGKGKEEHSVLTHDQDFISSLSFNMLPYRMKPTSILVVAGLQILVGVVST